MSPDAPSIELPGYTVRPLRREDAPALTAVLVIPAVKQHTSSTVNSVADVAPMIERSLSPEPGAPVSFAVCSTEEGRLVGMFGFHTLSPVNRTAELTYTLHPDHWGRGLATACARAACTWGFGVRGWVRIQGTTLEPNLASQRVLLKAGFAYEGRLRHFRIVRGEPRDYLLFAAVPPRPSPGLPTGLGLRRVHHVAIICADYARSRHFYVDLLGLRVLAENMQPARGSIKLDLALPDGGQIELFHFASAPPRPSYPEARGLRHLAFAVDDVAAAREQLQSRGVAVQPLRVDGYTGRRFAFLADPDDLPIELYEDAPR